MTLLVLIGDFWLSLNIESMKYSFFIFLAANIFAVIHFNLSRSYYLILLNFFSIILNCYAIYNYFNFNLELSIFSCFFSFLIIFFYFIFYNKFKLNNIKKSNIYLSNEITYSFLTFLGMLFISLNKEFYSLIGFSIWLFSTPFGIKISKLMDSKGLYYQVIAYIPIELIAIISYSKDFEFIFIVYSFLIFILIYLLFTTKDF